MKHEPSLLSATNNSRVGRELTIVSAPIIIVVIWFLVVNVFHLYTSETLGFVVLARTVPVLLATLFIFFVRAIYPVKIDFITFVKTTFSCILAFMAVGLFYIFRSNMGPNGNMIVIYEFTISGFWLITGVNLATILGSSLGKWFGKMAT